MEADSGSQLPWAQIEFYYRNDKLCFSRYAALNGSTNYHYSDASYPDWLWHSEFDLGKTVIDFRDHSSILARLGDWWECPLDNAGVNYSSEYSYGGDNALFDDFIAIFPVDKETEVSDSTMLEPGVSCLACRHNADDAGYGYYRGEVLEPSQLDPISGTMTSKWRSLDRRVCEQGEVRLPAVPNKQLSQTAKFSRAG